MKKTIAVLAGLLALVSLRAQAPVSLDYFLPDTCNYNKSIPTPASVLGFEIGEFQATPELAVAYIKALAAASDRVLLRQYGWTHERRPLYLLIISTEQNIRDIDRIKAEHDKLSDPSANGSTDGPVFNWFGNSIHGNETSGFNASLLLAYHLAAANTPYTQKVLESNIVLIDPMINPDGIGRFSEWANSHRSSVPNVDDQELEHNEMWPGSRSNHYWFDLNRDWINQTQPESQYRAVAMLDWKPNIYTCAHEKGSDANYHFSPGEPTRVHPLIPDECQAFIHARRAVGVHSESTVEDWAGSGAEGDNYYTALIQGTNGQLFLKLGYDCNPTDAPMVAAPEGKKWVCAWANRDHAGVWYTVDDDTPTSVESAQDAEQGTKVLKEGVVYIQRNDQVFTVQGQPTK